MLVKPGAPANDNASADNNKAQSTALAALCAIAHLWKMQDGNKNASPEPAQQGATV